MSCDATLAATRPRVTRLQVIYFLAPTRLALVIRSKTCPTNDIRVNNLTRRSLKQREDFIRFYLIAFLKLLFLSALNSP